MTQLVRKDDPYVWIDECHEVFERLKEALSTAPLLKSPEFGKPLLVTYEASEKVVAGVLSQEGRLISYESQKLKETKYNYPMRDLEFIGVVHTCEVWRHYLLG